MKLPSFNTYGNYSSDNYGAHCLVFRSPTIDVYFSYKTPVAFETIETGLVVRENDWGPTTGKHLNWIDGGGGETKSLVFQAMDLNECLTTTIRTVPNDL